MRSVRRASGLVLTPISEGIGAPTIHGTWRRIVRNRGVRLWSQSRSLRWHEALQLLEPVCFDTEADQYGIGAILHTSVIVRKQCLSRRGNQRGRRCFNSSVQFRTTLIGTGVLC
jgi:hypothetical protein